MRLLTASAALVLIAASATATHAAAQASAQTQPQAQPRLAGAQQPAAPLGPPRGFAGYAQPEVGGAMCRNIGPSQSTCNIPAMTAGRYRIRAAATSTSQGEGAVQALSIQVGSRSCGRIDNKNPWPSGARTVRLDCEILVMTDRPLAVSALYADARATKDPRGPSIAVERLPWDGVLSTQVSAPQQ